jgi:hypothetical protein
MGGRRSLKSKSLINQRREKAGSKMILPFLSSLLLGGPNGIRTRVTDVRVPSGGFFHFFTLSNTPNERKRIASLKYSSNGEATREMVKVKIKIPLSPPLQKGDKKQFSPLAKSVRLDDEGS